MSNPQVDNDAKCVAAAAAAGAESDEVSQELPQKPVDEDYNDLLSMNKLHTKVKRKQD